VRDATIARSYAEALLDVGRRHRQEEAFADALLAVAALLRAEPRIRTFLETPKIELAEKRRVLRDALAGQVPPLLLNFLYVVLDKRRHRLIPAIADAYRDLVDEHLGRLHVQVTLAREPAADARADIGQRLSGILGRTAVPVVVVDPAILGGIIVRYRDRVLDGSLRRRLLALRTRMVAADLNVAG
jgi:F-type H+-transporting ATPase subunit delta